MSQVDEAPECPLCMEPLEVDDLNFFPCTCGYQICRFCWHRIRTDENGLCPACRKAYGENPADFKPLSQEQVVKMKAEKRHKEQQRKQKATESRKHLANVRVVQKNLVFVVGLPMRLADTSMLKKHEYFGKFGRIHKVVINQSTTYAGAMGPSASAYVTYSRCDDALRAIEAVNNICVDSRVLKTSLGTTKYCSHFIKSQSCPKPDCMYLHDFGDSEASFTKEEMQHGKHQEYEKKLHEQLNLMGTVERKTASPPQGAKQEAWPSLNINGVVPVEPETKPLPPPPPVTAPANGKGKRHGKEKAAQEKGKRKGKEKAEKGDGHALQTSQSESCISSGRSQSSNHNNRSSMILENSSFYEIGMGSSNKSGKTKPVESFMEEPSPPESPELFDEPPTQIYNDPTILHFNGPITQLYNGPTSQYNGPRTQQHNGYREIQPSPSPSPHSIPTPPSPRFLPTPSSPQSVHTPPSPPSPPQVEIQDDELGFDPFQETQKGLADLLEKELALQQKAAETIEAQPTLPPSLYLHSYQAQHVDPAILTQIHSNHQHRVAANARLERRPLPPPGFSAPHPLSHQQSHTMQIPQHPPPHLDLFSRGVNGTKPQQSFYLPNGVPKLADWPETLRNLVHESNHPHHLGQHNPSASLHRQDKGWNSASSFADWTALDPAIVSSSRPHMAVNLHSPPPMYNQGMGGMNGGPLNLGGLGHGGWSNRYHDAYFKTHIHNTSVPPPGFSLLHPSGSGLNQSLSSGIETMD